MVRSAVAVVAGYVLIVALVMAFDVIHGTLVGVPEKGQVPLEYMIINLASGAVAGVIGAYMTAMIAGRAPTQHALALGIFSLVVGIATSVKYWGDQPVWYQATLLGMVVPLAFVGGRLRAWQMKRRPSAS